MAKNFKNNGHTMRYTAGGAISAGDPVQVGALVGVALSDMAIGETDELSMGGSWSFPKDGAAYSQGDLVDWDGSQVVAGGGGSYNLGYVWKDAAGGDAEVEVHLVRP